MIVKLIPENDVEKSKMKTIEHKGVRNFFMFGIKKEQDGDMRDFHDWNGDFKFLIGNLRYFETVITNEQNYKMVKERELRDREITLNPQMVVKSASPMIKKGNQPDNQVIELLTPENLDNVEKKDSNALKFATDDGFETLPPKEDKEDQAGE